MLPGLPNCERAANASAASLALARAIAWNHSLD